MLDKSKYGNFSLQKIGCVVSRKTLKKNSVPATYNLENWSSWKLDWERERENSALTIRLKKYEKDKGLIGV